MPVRIAALILRPLRRAKGQTKVTFPDDYPFLVPTGLW